MTIMKRKDYITPIIELFVMDADDILDKAPQSWAKVYSDPPDDDDVSIRIDNSDDSGFDEWDLNDETL